MVEPKQINLADIVEDEDYVENDPSTWADSERLPDDERIITDFNNRVVTPQKNSNKNTNNKSQSGGKSIKTKRRERTRKTKRRKQIKKSKKYRRRTRKSKKHRKK